MLICDFSRRIAELPGHKARPYLQLVEDLPAEAVRLAVRRHRPAARAELDYRAVIVCLIVNRLLRAACIGYDLSGHFVL